MEASVQSALFAAQQPALPTASRGGIDPAKAAHVAKEYESVFISQFLSSMFSGIKTDGPFGGGAGEEMFRSLMTEAMGKQVAKAGGIGISDMVQKQLLELQETPR